jgi:hypothetical protein
VRCDYFLAFCEHESRHKFIDRNRSRDQKKSLCGSQRASEFKSCSFACAKDIPRRFKRELRAGGRIYRGGHSYFRGGGSLE